MRCGFIAAVFTSALLAVGCRDSGGPAPGAEDQPFEGRLKAALAMERGTSKDLALAAVAKDAAAAGAGHTVKRAVAGIDHSTSKDEVAARAALKLAEVGNASAATEVAKLIEHETSREHVLAKIARSGKAGQVGGKSGAP